MQKAWLVIKNKNTREHGFSLAELLIAVALLGIIATSIYGAIISIYQATDQSGRRTRALALVEEGLEAARNLRDGAYSNLNDGVFGLSANAGRWIFNGTSDTTEIFNRQITISTPAANRKQINSRVTWADRGANRSVEAVTYLTNWRALLTTPYNLLTYSIGTTIPQYRTYNSTSDSFSPASGTVTGNIGRVFGMRSSPTQNETIAGYVNNAGNLQVMCLNGSNWTNEWSVSVGGTGTTKRFDIAYETNSGDVLVVYSRNTATTNELGFRTKPGSSGCGSANWSGENTFDPVRTSGTVHWVKMAWDRRTSSNLIAVIWADSKRDLSAVIWNGSGFVNEPLNSSETNLEIVTTAQDIDDFDVEYESVSGDVMMVWANAAGSNGTNGVRYRVCTGGTSACAWGAVTTPPTFSDDATNLDISANPNTNEIVFASVGNSANDLQIGYWSGSAWTNTANVDTSCTTPFAGSKKVATGWLINGGTTRSIVVYDDQGGGWVNWYTGNVGVFSSQTDFVPSTTFVPNQGWYDIQMNPANKAELMFLTTDSDNDLFAKRLTMTAAPIFTWSNSDGGPVLTAALPQNTVSPFGFTYSRGP